MSHLIIEQGKDVGKEVTVPAAGIKFGRSPANDLVLEDEALMLFQGRFFFKSDGTLWVTDFSVEEKSHIGGVPIDEQQLKPGDLVEVGSSAFRVISTRKGEAGAVEPAAPVEAPGGAIDLGFKPAPKTAKGAAPAESHTRYSSPMYRVLQVAVIVLVLLIVFVGASEFMRSKGRAKTGAVHMKGIFFTYECVRADANNIFRYSLELTPQGVATLTVDDVRSRHFVKSAQLAPDDLAALTGRVKGNDFFRISGDRVGKVANKYDLYEVVLGCDGEFNQVRVVNRELPPDMRQMVNTLEEFAFNALDVSRTLLKDDTTLILYAQDAYKLAEERYRDRETGFGNLALCIKHLKESINYLETIEPKPEPYAQATSLLSKVRVEQNERYKEYMFYVDQAMHSGDWNEARRNLRILAQLIPDRSDERYDTISAKTLKVEDKLR